MAAGLGFKTFAVGEVLSAANVNGYLMQGIWVFANAAARDAAVTSPQEGNACYLKDTDVIQVYSGSAWVTKSGGSSPLTTKGDLYTYSTTDARIGVGANDTVLTADSSTATGLKWAAPASTANFVGCTLYMSANQGIPNDTWTTILFDSELFDTNSFHSTTTNTGRITIPSGKAGKYLIIGNWVWDSVQTQFETYLGLNGGLSYLGPQNAASSGKPTSNTKTWILDLAVGDYLELKGLHKVGVTVNMLGTDDHTQFSVQYLGA